jgi:poly-gamma-glutamate synthase PgsB/CapB
LGVLIFLLAVLVVLWTHESWLHRLALRSIPIRIHVNGSRGKSSVTRLLAAALREGGIRTIGKVTGSKPRLILTDGSEEPIIRLGGASLREQITILDRARHEKAQAMVMECMAVRPDLQEVAEHQIMHATIGVITNVRPDHLDVMGPTVEDVAVALSSTVPKGGVMVLGDARYSSLVGRVARGRGCELRLGHPENVPPEAMEGFPYLEHEENVATVLEVTRLLNIKDDVALRGMYKAIPDIGACLAWRFRHLDCDIEFSSVFAANDIESTITVWQKLGLDWSPEESKERTVAIINLRADRLDRSMQFAESVEKSLRADHYILIGGAPERVRRRFHEQVPAGRLWMEFGESAETLFDKIAEFSRGRARVAGIGNIGGPGHDVLAFAANAGGVSGETAYAFPGKCKAEPHGGTL